MVGRMVGLGVGKADGAMDGRPVGDTEGGERFEFVVVNAWHDLSANA